VSDFTHGRLVGLLAEADRIIFRHDVDYDPECALRMAEVEHDHHVRATYYIMGRGSYNPFAADVKRILYGILALGHDLGCHVDLGLPRDAGVPDWVMSRAAIREHRLLSAEYPVTRKVSFHAPPSAVYWRDVHGFDHAMSANWRDRYLADSRGVWRDSPEDALEALRPGERLQLNLHPEWWFWPAEKADEWRVVEAAKP